MSGQQVGGRVRVDVSADTVGPRPARQRLHVPLLDEVRLDGRAAVTGRRLPGDRNGMFEDLADDQRTSGGCGRRCEGETEVTCRRLGGVVLDIMLLRLSYIVLKV